MSYILVTLCRDEEKNLPNLAESILTQTEQPLLWVIVDDRSIDSTSSIIKNLEKQYKWVQGLYLNEPSEYMGFHYSRIFNQGFDFAVKICLENNISYDYVALVDADNILENDYFEKLIYQFQKNPKLGIASGINAFIDIDVTLKEIGIANVMDSRLWDFVNSNKIKFQVCKDDIPMGSARLWAKKCFDETGGYLFTHSPDSASNIKAKMLGWETKRFPNALVVERAGLVAQGPWEGYKKRGMSDYYIWYPPSLSILKAIKWSARKPYCLGAAYLYGYLTSYFNGTKRLDDADVKKYNQTMRPKEIKFYYITKIKKILGL